MVISFGADDQGTLVGSRAPVAGVCRGVVPGMIRGQFWVHRSGIIVGSLPVVRSVGASPRQGRAPRLVQCRCTAIASATHMPLAVPPSTW